MKKAVIFFFFSFLMMNGNCFAQNNQFVREYDKAGRDYVDITSSGYVMFGMMGNATGAYVTKTDKAGNISWSKIFTDNGGGIFQGIKKIQGERYVCVIGGSGSGNFILFEMDSIGTINWSTKFHSTMTINGYGVNITNPIERLWNGDLVVVGTGGKVCFIHTDSIGNLISSGSAHHTQQGNYVAFDPWMVRQLPNKDLVFAGTFVDVNSVGWGWSFRTDSSSTQLKYQFKYLSTTPYTLVTEGYNLLMTMRGTPCQSCSSNVVVRVDTTGNGFGRTYTETTQGLWRDFKKTSDGGYVFTGWSRSFAGGYNSTGVLIKTDSLFLMQWAKRLGKTGFLDQGEVSTYVKQTPDGGYIVNGLRLVKTDSSGTAGCLDSAVTYTMAGVGSIVPAPYNINMVLVLDTFNVSVLTSNLISTVNPIIDNIYCFTGINDQEANNEIEIYPNPSSDKITIHFEKFTNEKTNAILYNIFGQQILFQKISSAQSEMDIHQLASGIYFLQIKMGEKVAGKKIVKE